MEDPPNPRAGEKVSGCQFRRQQVREVTATSLNVKLTANQFVLCIEDVRSRNPYLPLSIHWQRNRLVKGPFERVDELKNMGKLGNGAGGGTFSLRPQWAGASCISLEILLPVPNMVSARMVSCPLNS